jgi:cytochrome c oxidase subunit 2
VKAIRALAGRLAAAVTLAAAGAALGGCSGSTPRFGMPNPATRAEHSTLHLWQGVFIAAGVIGVLVWGLIFWSIIRYRKKAGDEDLPKQFRYNIPLEITYTIIPVVIVAVIFFFVVRAENRVDATVKDPPVTLKVEGFQWGWRFTYLSGPDGSPIGPPIVGDQINNPTLTLPVGQTVQLQLFADDVIHSFFVPDFLFKRDLIPRVNNTVDFYIQRPGHFQGHCAEFCGEYHALMGFTINAVSLPEFRTFMAGQSAGAVP